MHKNWVYSYDDFNRLISSVGGPNNYTYTYDYDRFGNRWNQKLNGGCTAGTTACVQFDANNRMTNGTQTYDAAGNVRSDSTNTYVYDAENHLISLGNGTTYGYEADGQRISKTTAGALTDFIYDRDGHIILTNPSAPTQVELYVDGMHLATKTINAQQTDTNTYFDHADWLGTERARTDWAGNLCETVASIPFGDGETPSTTCSEGDVSTMHFTGKQRDVESGLDDFGARYDSSSFGRFMSPDSLLDSGRISDPQTWNRYAYALNNPLRIVDPSGLYDWDKSAGGDMSDEDLQGIANDKHNKRHKWAKNALNFRDKFRNALDSADEAAGNSALSDDQQSAAQASVDAYGSEGDGNGVSVGSQSGYGGSTVLNNDDTISVKFGSSIRGDFLTATVAHEGAHIDQANAWLDGGESSVGDLSHYSREQAAWLVGSSIAQALGMKSLAPHGGGPDLQVWNRGWKAADVETLRSKGVQNVLNYMRDTSSDADMRRTFSEEHHHQD